MEQLRRERDQLVVDKDKSTFNDNGNEKHFKKGASNTSLDMLVDLQYLDCNIQGTEYLSMEIAEFDNPSLDLGLLGLFTPSTPNRESATRASCFVWPTTIRVVLFGRARLFVHPGNEEIQPRGQELNGLNSIYLKSNGSIVAGICFSPRGRHRRDSIILDSGISFIVRRRLEGNSID
ncbi:hypothetical protein CkaCkLH20_12246 [Colletotrichum karsti]|uniref:Uncharacterized protein n=1 Tax=Colletotrichum karsti TaxID=1095194 RepID=A0A9P6HSY4_9PEZI|nr:uncharacterized protein CkaCkLH20_12246 [Colletotrichum karsti]KAF9870282.1 hypothetical protein CkaCkLH20_12246 [Colletotrichum karsti]